jgi:hypothetical protein
MRPIDISGFKAPAASPDAGAAPMLQWIKIAEMVVDDAYQRPIYGAGRSNVARIAEGFCWSKFAPVIVAPVPGGQFAIIDGQHRTTAAALLGIESVPCQVVVASPVEQAAAFKAINGQVTRIHSLALQHAAVAAGDPAAVEVQEVARAAGVEILRYPRVVERLEPGQTLALGSIAQALRTYGRDVVITALTCVTETANHRPGALSAAIIKALVALVGGNAEWRELGEPLLRAFDEIDLEHEMDEAMVTRRAKGVAAWEVLADRLKARVAQELARAALDTTARPLSLLGSGRVGSGRVRREARHV